MAPPGGRFGGVAAITFDFGNTLVPVDRASLRRVVELTCDRVAERSGPFDRDVFLAIWAEERERQFREDVPAFREVDMAQRFRRVLARLRGMPAPPATEPWDDAAAATRSAPDEITAALETYTAAFVEAMPVPPGVTSLLARLAARKRLAIVSNWPLAATIDRYVDAAGWGEHLAAVVVSQRVGAIKPQRAMFEAAEAALGLAGPAILHVGDDWRADVVGAIDAGWRAAWLATRPADSPLPGSDRMTGHEPDVVIERLEDLEPALG